MNDQLLAAWQSLQGGHGLLNFLVHWRALLAVAVPLINSKLQSKFTELLDASPTVANDIVDKKWYQTITLILRITLGIRLPDSDSLLVHTVKHSGNTEFLTKPTDAPKV